jgi:hypothetical protein
MGLQPGPHFPLPPVFFTCPRAHPSSAAGAVVATAASVGFTVATAALAVKAVGKVTAAVAEAAASSRAAAAAAVAATAETCPPGLRRDMRLFSTQTTILHFSRYHLHHWPGSCCFTY